MMNSKRLFRQMIGLTLAVWLVGCGGAQVKPTPTPIPPTATPSITAEPSATPQQPTVAPASEDISLTFVNATDVDICTIAATVSGTDDRSDNILEETLKPGDNYTFTDLEPMVLDLFALDCTDKVIAESLETPIDGAYTWEITGFDIAVSEPPEPPPTTPGQISLTFVNATDVDICAIEAAVSGTNDRSDNILEETLKPGDDYTFTDLEPMVLDLFALDCTDQVIAESFETPIDSAYTWEITGFDVTTFEPPEPPPTTPEQVWLVMLYIDADDEPLEQAIFFDLNEAELAGSSDQVHIVAQVDRFEGGFAGDGDWSTTKRFYVTQDADLNTVSSEELMDLGEVNMADGSTLADFVSWAVETHPADKYVLILSDHGAGWPGGWTDQSASGDTLTLLELEGALAQVQTETSLEQFELIGFDACLMSSLEVHTAIAPYARYGVASEELEPAYGWAYASFLADLVSDPGMGGADLAQSIVQHYIDGDAALVGAPEEYVQQRKADVTLSAIDLATVPDLLAALDALAVAASETDQGYVALARFYSQSYFSYLGREYTGSFLDLGHLARMLAEEGRSNKVSQASRQLLAILDQTVIAEKHGQRRPGSTGISLYFPNSTLYGSYDMLPGSKTYTTLAGRFASESLWDDFLLSHYAGVPMPGLGTGTIAFADQDATIVGPGVGHIEIAPISASSEVFSMDNPAFLSTEITGGHVAQIYLFWGLYVEESNALLVLANDFVSADVDKEVNGVIYPDWVSQTADGVLSVGGDVWPQNKTINDGTSSAAALFWPKWYGGERGGTWVIEGIHISAATGEQRRAMMYFELETPTMLSLYVLTEEGGVVTPYEFTPQPGDQFIVVNTWIDQTTGEWSYFAGDILTFGDEPFYWDTAPADPGQYLLGAIVVDMDGNEYKQFITLTVEAD